STEQYAEVAQGLAHHGTQQQIGKDGHGNAMNHLVLEADGNYYLYSRLTGRRHYVPQTRDTVVNNEKVNPFTLQDVYSPKASYAMGRHDGNTQTGMGPIQDPLAAPTDFKHGDSMDCASCHASWTNTCMGCHLEGEYNRGNNFSNITGQQIVFRERNADFVYQSPVFFQLGVNARSKVTQTSSNTKMFFKWRDRNGQFSRVFAFSSRNLNGNNPSATNPHPSLGHNAMMAHSIRGRVSDRKEGPRYCVACHLTQDGLDQYGTLYDQFRTAMAQNRYDLMPAFETIAPHFGANTGNDKNSPLWVHMVAGLGSGLFLFDENGCPINPLDQDNERKGCIEAPATTFDPDTFMTRVRFNLDRVVTEAGVATGQANHPLLDPAAGDRPREGAQNEELAGPLGFPLIRRLTDPTPGIGIILTGYLDANGMPVGTAIPLLTPPPAPQQAAAKPDDDGTKK
ncbi:MAG: hypothetical protein OER88_02750, partial [Planctomycetota bacterium]|nr:hypothetical protein [Planctomycetota bacterium]